MTQEEIAEIRRRLLKVSYKYTAGKWFIDNWKNDILQLLDAFEAEKARAEEAEAALKNGYPKILDEMPDMPMEKMREAVKYEIGRYMGIIHKSNVEMNRLRTRNEALERAIKQTNEKCYSCKGCRDSGGCDAFNSNYEFDEEKFVAKGG